jgi:hypothetical protein
VKTNLTCDACRMELTAYVDGELHPAVARVIDDHTASCASCRAILEQYRAIAASARRLPSIEAPAWLADRVVAQVTRPARIRALWTRVSAAAAAASFVLTVGMIAFWPRLSAQFGLPQPGTWLASAIDGVLNLLVATPKRLAMDVTFYEPIARQIWIAISSLSSIPRATFLALRTPEAQATGIALLTLGVALYLIVRPSRSHERGIGHACLSL